MKKDKTVSTKRGRNFNILLTVVALVLIVAVGGFATYSWVEQATTLDVQMNGTIQRVPGDNEGRVEYHHQVTLSKTDKSPADAISLNDYLDKTSDMVLRPVSSANGKDFFMQTEEKVDENSSNTFTRAGNTSDRNVSYISFDFDVTSDTETGIYFDDGKDPDGNKDETGNYFKPSFKFGTGDELESVRVAIQVNDETPMIFSQSGEKYNGINNVNGDTTEVTPRKFSECIFGEGNSIFTLKKDTKTKVRITIWIEGTYKNLGEEYRAGETLNMKLMLTTPWHKATTVELIDKTANSMFNGGSGTFTVYDSDNGDSEIAVMKESEGGWTANITDSQKNLTFKYVDGTTEYSWTASGRGENSCYYIFDCDPAYGVWGTESFGTETIDISQIWIDGTQLTTPTVNGLDSHIKVSTDGEKYYRAAYDSKNSKWYVNIDADYSELYVQYYNDDSALTAKWNATEGRENKTTQTTYYLLDTDGKTTDYSTGSWTDTYNIYFYDGTAQQITSKANTSIAYEAFSGKTRVSYGSVEKDTDSSATYRFIAKGEFKYSDKINRVVFTLKRKAANATEDDEKVTYIWNGNGKLNKDIYYTANSYTKDKD